ncbi:hypothetical protein SLEP1_g54071 [Rubroshorea leprosula]|uniref:Secreted protein n=1 Tax=Rubroshorea leprosula TaxID=152421 RepID=A0AAV5MB98_9ROSI|nr:hypothetical protein SLEP1_g54071 [Rubroshorea leprosula]
MASATSPDLDPRILLFFFLPTPCNPTSSPATATHLRPGTPVKLGNFSSFSCSRTPIKPKIFQICSLPSAASSL